ncbi:hypothetical protein VP01_2736g3 [Puccinia sorghi]|uniref:Uncharacterized protein n=1 Tax=Puccinia sorghi TaxID=27349 RepID=A0A0L6V502_9BASI|nr:hypothetical protein VP01_2736g3 [Puccinia sorghi]
MVIREQDPIEEFEEAAVAEVQNHLISMRQVKTLQLQGTGTKRTRMTLDFEDTTIIYMEKLYQAHQPNMKYEKDFPIFIDPTDPNQYIPLTLATVQAWAEALVCLEFFQNTCLDLIFANVNLCRTWGLSISSPPSSLQFHEEVLKILHQNNLTSFKHFKSNNITQDHMSRWGLSNVNIIAQLRDNVLKCKKILHHPKV